MKNLSSLIKENSETKKYKYTATVTVEGTVTAMSEGDAGELVDKEIDTIENVTDYKIDSIDEVETGVGANRARGLCPSCIRRLRIALRGFLALRFRFLGEHLLDFLHPWVIDR